MLRARSPPLVDADAIPLLAAADDFPLLHRDADDTTDIDAVPSESPSSLRRKRHGGTELNSGIVRLVRRRGRSSSVPADLRAVAAHSRDADERQLTQERTRSGSAASTFAIASRRRAATTGSGLLSRFRRRKDPTDEPLASCTIPFPKPRAKRRVHFKTTLYPEVVPDVRAHVPSYDELLFAVGGLYQTLSLLHDPVPDDTSTESSGSTGFGAFDDISAHAPPPERSMQLLIAEFLFRSAAYLGLHADSSSTPWLPGFRDAKRFSVNDVKRWRRLAHHDWALEDQQLHQQQTTGTNATTATVQKKRRQSSATSSGSRLRAAVTSWLQRRRRHSAPARLAMNHPPPVPATADLSLLVAIANSCVYFGAFRLSARDIFVLCNVDIEAKHPAAARADDAVGA